MYIKHISLKSMSFILEKVLALHQTGLPYDVVQYINSFLFYDQHQHQVRYNKLVVNKKIKDAYNGQFYGQWWFYTFSDAKAPQFQASCCRLCGNYFHGNNFYNASSKCICTCILK